MPLTDAAVRNAKSRAKPYKMSDSAGLYLQVQPNGSKLWRLKYRYLGTEKKLSIGPYPEIGLAEARRRRDASREQLYSFARESEGTSACRGGGRLHLHACCRGILLEAQARWGQGVGAVDRIALRIPSEPA